MSKTATDKNRALAERISRRADRLVLPSQANILRRAERTLSRWSEDTCNGYIQRDDDTGKPFRVYGPDHQYRSAAPDREAGALRRVAELCDALGLHFYHQTDPRGCALYVAAEPLTDQTYHRGVACCDD